MTKPEATTKSSKVSTSTSTASASADTRQATIKQSFWQLKTGTAKKLGKQAEGGISYQFLTDPDRKELLFSITGNDGGGYFSREIVPFSKVEACISKLEQGKPFASKTFKETFTGRSSNNAGFLAAILRAEGLLAASPDSESQHVIAGDWSGWKSSSLSEAGTMIEIDAIKPAEKQVEGDPVPDHTEHKKTLTLPRKKTP